MTPGRLLTWTSSPLIRSLGSVWSYVIERANISRILRPGVCKPEGEVHSEFKTGDLYLPRLSQYNCVSLRDKLSVTVTFLPNFPDRTKNSA